MAAYAITRARNGATGDVRFSGVTWVRSDAPALELVALVLHTELGSCGADPSRGVNFKRLQKAAPNAGAAWKSEVERALKPLVDRKLVTGLVVTVTVERDRLTYQVDFTDPRTAARSSFRETL